MVNKLNGYERKYLLYVNGIAAIFILILLYKAIENNKLNIGLEICVFLILVLFYLNDLFKISNTFFIDIRLSFILGYCCYNLYTPIVYCFKESEILEYGSRDFGWIFNSKDVEKALLISILFLLGLLLALIFTKRKNANTQLKCSPNIGSNNNMEKEFNFWLVIFMISFFGIYVLILKLVLMLLIIVGGIGMLFYLIHLRSN